MRHQTHSGLLTALGGLLAMLAAMGLGRFVYTPILPYMVIDLGLPKFDAGLIASSNFFGYLIGAFATSRARLPGGRRRWMLAMLAVSAVTTGAMGLGSSLAWFLLLRFVGGIASAVVLVCASTLVLGRLAEHNQSQLVWLHFAGVGCGIALSAPLTALLGTSAASWPMLWYGSGLVALLALAGCFRLLPPLAEKPRPHQPPAARDGRLTRLIVSYGLFGFGYVITATFLSDMVRSTPALQAAAPAVWLCVGLSGIPSVLLWNAVGRRIGARQAIALACLVEAVGVVFCGLMTGEGGSADNTGGTLAILMLSAALLGGTFIGITALGLSTAERLASGDPRRSIALMTTAFSLGQMIGPAFAGLIYDHTGSFLLPSLVAGGALLGAALLAHPATVK